MTGKEMRIVTKSTRPELPEKWKTMSATEKTRALLDRKDLPALVQTMPADKLYLMIHEIGVDSSLELFSFVEPDQWKGLVDISCWESDMSSPQRFAAWFEAGHRAGAEIYRSIRSSGSGNVREWLNLQHGGQKNTVLWQDLWNLATLVDFVVLAVSLCFFSESALHLEVTALPS